MAEKKRSINMWKIAKMIGLDSILCSNCGSRVKAGSLIEDFFKKIIDECRSGKVVKLKNFGAFEAKKLKARIVKSPVLKGGETKMDQMIVLRFRNTAKARRLLNGRPDPYGVEEDYDG